MAKKLTMSIVGDPNSGVRALATMQNQAGKFTGALAGINARGKNTWGGLAAAMSASGIGGEFGQLQMFVSNLSGAFSQMGEEGKTSFGKIVTGVGIAAAAAGGVALLASKPLADAQAALKQSVSDSGVVWGSVSGQIGQQDKAMEKLGFTYADTDEALAKMTQSLGTPAAAMARLGLDADLARRQHTSLASAADLVAKIYAKSPMVLRQFGINLTDTTKAGTAATKAQTAQAKATAELTVKQQALVDLQQRLGVGQGTKAASDAAAVTRAQDALATAGQHLQTVQAKLLASGKGGAAAQGELEAAQMRVTAATAKLDQAEAKLADTGGLTVTQQQELRKATEAVFFATLRKQQADKQAAATAGDLSKANLTGNQILDMVVAKTHGLAKAQADTFGGKLREARARITDFSAVFGQRFGKDLIIAGPAIAGVGSVIESGLIGKVGKATVALAKMPVTLAKTGVEAGKSAVEFGKLAYIGGRLAISSGLEKGAAFASKFGGAMKTLGSNGLAAGKSIISAGASIATAGASAIVPWLPFIAAAAAVAAAGYLIYRNWGTIERFFKNIWGSIEHGAVAAWHGVESFVTTLPTKIVGLLTGAPHWLLGIGKEAIHGLELGGLLYLHTLEFFYIKIPLQILSWLGDAAKWLFTLGGKALVGLWNGFWAMSAWFSKQLTGLPGKILGWLGDAGKWLVDVGSNMIKGLWQGISKMGGWIGDKLKGFIKGVPVLGSIAKHLGILSPSTVMADYGKNMVLGLAQGIDRNAATAAASVAKLATTAFKPMLGAKLPGEGGGSSVPVAAGGPQVVHYHQHDTMQVATMNVQAADLNDLKRQMASEISRGNFSGAGSKWTAD